MTYEPITFSALPGWALDDHDAALNAFRNSIDHLRLTYPLLPVPDDSVSARKYFETHFVPHRVTPDGGETLFTGYFEPVLKGSRQRSPKFDVPLLRRPDDLATVIDDSLRASAKNTLTHARQTTDGLVPYATRQEIEQGCLDSHNLEFIYLQDPVEAYFLHIQGSGLIELDNGSRIRVSYAAKNGHPYTSIGKALIAGGIISSEDMSLQSLSAWLNADHERGKQMMWRNESYIFFKELGDATSTNTTGVHSIALTPGRSLAVDASVHNIGLPVFLDAPISPNIKDQPILDPIKRFQHLMIAQDVGSAIRGAVRGDIFYGSGPIAGSQAGLTKHPGEMYVLLPCNIEAG